jgi:hypothetical protein
VYVDLYHSHTLGSASLIGSVSLNLANVPISPVPTWYELRKVKGRNSEARGMIQMAVWFNLKDGPVVPEKPVAFKSDIKSAIGADGAIAQKEAAFASEPRGQLAIGGNHPPGTGDATLEYANASVYARAAGGAIPPAQQESPKFVPLASSALSDADEAAQQNELEENIITMMADDAVYDCSWSEYSVRLLDTVNLDRVASGLMVDLTAGRVVCYVTCPLFRRGYSVMVSDGTDVGILEKWANQDIVFALPDQIAANIRAQAVLRFSFYFYPKGQQGLTGSILGGTSREESVFSLASYTSAAGSNQGPLLLGTCAVPLLSVYTHKLDSFEGQKDSNPEIKEHEEENAQVDVAGLAADPEAKERARIKRIEEKQRRLSAEERASNEWKKKWIALGTPRQTAETASMCVRIRRKEVKMPTSQAVSRKDKLASYCPPRIRLKLKLPLIGVSLIDATPEEVAYFALQNTQLVVQDSATTTSIRFALDKMQLDNLVHDAIFPVLLHASSVAPKDWMPVLQVAINKQKVPSCNIQCFQYISFLLQSLDVKCSELYIYKVLNFVNDLQKRVQPDQSTVDLLSQCAQKDKPSPYEEILYRRMSDEFKMPPASINNVYFQFLHLQPLAINLTFAANPGIRNQYLNSVVVNPLTMAFSAIEAGVGSLDAAPIRLNGKIIERRLDSPKSFAKTLAIHYIKEGVKQIYKVLGSLELIG